VCSPRKYPYSPFPQNRLEFPGDGGEAFCKAKKFNEIYEANWDFHRGGEGVDIF